MLKRVVRRFSEVHCKLDSLDKGIRVLTLQREKPKNALGKLLVEQLRDNLNSIKFDQEARVAIVKSSVEGVFCSGADLKERKEMNELEVEMFVDSLRQSFNEIEDLPVPVIGVVEGFALGGGLELALACDFRFALPSAVVALPETSLAIIPGAGGTQRLPRLIGTMRAKQMIFTGARFTAEQVAGWGLFTQISESPYQEALGLAEQIASNGPIAVKMAKLAIKSGVSKELQEGMQIEKLCYARIIPTQDRIEALKAFQEKRKPQFQGK